MTSNNTIFCCKLLQTYFLNISILNTNYGSRFSLHTQFFVACSTDVSYVKKSYIFFDLLSRVFIIIDIVMIIIVVVVHTKCICGSC